MRRFLLWICLPFGVIAAVVFLQTRTARTPRMQVFDNMDHSSAENGEHVLLPPHRIAADVAIPVYGDGIKGGHTVFTAPVSYFASGKSGAGEEDMLPVELTNALTRKQILQQGKTLYMVHCAMCHGENGSGKGNMSKYDTYSQISSFQDPQYMVYSYGKLFASITHGQGNMPAYGKILTVRDLWCIVAYVRHLQSEQNE